MTPDPFALGFASGMCATMGLIAAALWVLWLIFRGALNKILGG